MTNNESLLNNYAQEQGYTDIAIDNAVVVLEGIIRGDEPVDGKALDETLLELQAIQMSRQARDTWKQLEDHTYMLEALKEAKTIIYNLKNGLERRSETELQSFFDVVIKKATE